MPSAPLGYCSTPVCPNRAHGKCSTCLQQRAPIKAAASQANSDRRLHTSRWRRYSKGRLARNPWCIGYPAGVHPVATLAQCTDHRKPAKRCTDAEFWDPNNHASLCSDCNKRKGIAEEGGFTR
jgi:5-methylcytosine-specific restriction endonuclease McrA